VPSWHATSRHPRYRGSGGLKATIAFSRANLRRFLGPEDVSVPIPVVHIGRHASQADVVALPLCEGWAEADHGRPTARPAYRP
jgi:hypothetical protein